MILITGYLHDKLTFNFAKPVLNITTHTTDKNWHDVWSFRFGTEYKVTDWADLRFGYVYDQSPVPDATIDYILPDSDRNIFNIGLGLHSGNYSCDLLASYLIAKKRHITKRAMPDMVVDSDVSGESYIYGLQFGYKF